MDVAVLETMLGNGAGALVVIAWLIITNRRDRKRPNGGTSRADLAAKLSKIDDELCEVKERVARIEGRLEVG